MGRGVQSIGFWRGVWLQGGLPTGYTPVVGDGLAVHFPLAAWVGACHYGPEPSAGQQGR